MRITINALRREQDQLITDLFALALTFERARLGKNKRAAKKKSLIVNNKLKENGKLVAKLC